MTHSQKRSRARRQVIQVMYQSEVTERDLRDLVKDQRDDEYLLISKSPQGVPDGELIGEPLDDYARTLLEGIVSRLDVIDAWIEEAAENWTIERMPIVDRSIIRLASYEIVFCDAIPVGVAINEAVEIAKEFGGDDSPSFVNGVLGKIADRMSADADPSDAPSEDAGQVPETLETSSSS